MKVFSFSGSLFLVLGTSASVDSTLTHRDRIRADVQADATPEENELQAAAPEELEEITQFIKVWDDTKGEGTHTLRLASKKKARKSSRKSKKKKKRMPRTRDGLDSKDCVDHGNPSATRNGDKYKFKLYKEDAQCVDKDDKLYEYGQFDDVTYFSDCAEACVVDVESGILGKLRGFDWHCDEGMCRCLYDEGTLDSDTNVKFHDTSKDKDGKTSIEDGTGPVKGGKNKDKWYCAKLGGVEGFDVDVAFERERGRA